ncbi:hypothetical protein DSO57_1010682 [Entomophthora muscae]|uniref:Uncharacterized protein n=1 Tax=Entomophthora muscae TaxID=34485 RepID=A0ACC2SJ72_9FUNG|nr:hypothetical protein DSO57_1010682 [Entomophthora muscae]
MTLVRHHKLSESVVMKEELGRLKQEIKDHLKSIPESEEDSGEVASDDLNSCSVPEGSDEGESWYDFAIQGFTIPTIVATLGIVGFISLKNSFKK